MGSAGKAICLVSELDVLLSWMQAANKKSGGGILSAPAEESGLDGSSIGNVSIFDKGSYVAIERAVLRLLIPTLSY